MFEYDFDIDNKKKRKRNERTYLFIGQSGFCSVIDEDFNQTLTFQIEILSNFEYKIICTDNGQPPLSVTKKNFY